MSERMSDAEVRSFLSSGTKTASSPRFVLDEMLPSATRIAARYMGDDKADAYARRNAVEGEMLVRVRPSKIVALKAIAD